MVYELLYTIVFLGLFQDAWDTRASYGLGNLFLFGSLTFGLFYLSLFYLRLELFENRRELHDILNLNIFGLLFTNKAPYLKVKFPW